MSNRNTLPKQDLKFRRNDMTYTVKKATFLFLVFAGLLATGCDSFKSKEELREERKRALLEDPRFKKLVKKAEKELTEVLNTAGLEGEFDAQEIVKSELERLIKYGNKVGSLSIDIMSEYNTREGLKKSLERKGIPSEKKHNWLLYKDKLVAPYASTLNKILNIIAKAHNDEHIFDSNYEI